MSKNLMPKAVHLAVLTNPGVPAHLAILKNLEAAARPTGIKVLSVYAHTAEEIDSSFATIKRSGAEAVIVVADSFFAFRRKQIADLALRNRVPTLFASRGMVEAGGLLSYGQNPVDSFGRAATYVDKIFRGSKPADLPVEQPTKFELVVNLKTAKALGLTIPKELLLRADEVIE